MEPTDLSKEQFVTLREEIKGIQSRLYWTVIFGLFGIPILTFWAAEAANLALLLVPFSVLVLIVLFLAQQSHMMRAGRFIREHIENGAGASLGWEAWLESRSEFRLMDRHFLACFVVIFFVYYVTTIGMAMQQIMEEAASDPSGQYRVWMYGSAVVYAVGAIWAFSTLVHHWKSSVSTAAE
jgi:uncharacterized membrane protein